MSLMIARRTMAERYRQNAEESRLRKSNGVMASPSYVSSNSISAEQLLKTLKQRQLVEDGFGWGYATACLHFVCGALRRKREEAARKLVEWHGPPTSSQPSRARASTLRKAAKHQPQEVHVDSSSGLTSIASDDSENDTDGAEQDHPKAPPEAAPAPEEEEVDEAAIKDAAEQDAAAALTKALIGPDWMDVGEAQALMEAAEITQVTEQLIFPEFVSVFVRLCLVRYCPVISPEVDVGAEKVWTAHRMNDKKEKFRGARLQKGEGGGRLHRDGDTTVFQVNNVIQKAAVWKKKTRASREFTKPIAAAPARLRYAFQHHLGQALPRDQGEAHQQRAPQERKPMDSLQGDEAPAAHKDEEARSIVETIKVSHEQLDTVFSHYCYAARARARERSLREPGGKPQQGPPEGRRKDSSIQHRMLSSSAELTGRRKDSSIRHRKLSSSGELTDDRGRLPSAATAVAPEPLVQPAHQPLTMDVREFLSMLQELSQLNEFFTLQDVS
ncbi:unnamed protein product [Chrysoparadoxa australica]